ncbi:Alanine--tRNA ligase [Mucor velutinosus]|uniref:Alanine--tRNA ligase n=1 Tax=Mucor velutinosus TaxID=708070 RepID=A0AAN7DTZ7_9FUNG|nr:Alanine--tRNA ligase [Mucor velutinosus]
MFNTIRQYLSQNYQLGSNSSDNYQYRDNWHQQRNHHVGNWLADMAANQHQPFYEKDNRQHFWSRGRKKKQYYDPTRQPFDESMYFHNGYNNQRLKGKSSHKSLSSLFHRHRDEDDYAQNHYQQENGGLGSQYTNRSSSYRRQRHHSLPSSTKNPLQHQSFMNGAVPNNGRHPVMDIGLPVLTAAATTAGNRIGGMLVGNTGGGLGNPLLPQHHHQQLRQQQMLQQQQQQQPYYNRQSMPMQGQHYNNGMFDQYNQHSPYDGSPSQSQQYSDRHHFSSLFGRHHKDRSRRRYELDQHSLDTSPYSNSYHSPEQQHALNYYHQQQQQQQHHAYPYVNSRFGGGGGMSGNYPLQNNQKRHG